MATQTGPRLTIAGSCDGCCHLRGEEKVSRPRLIVSYVYHCGQPTMLKVHPFGAKPRKIGRTPATPAWCPELSAARLALDLLPPTFTARFAEALYASDDGKGSGALHALLAEVGGTPYDPENDPRYNGAGTATKKGGKR